MDWGEVVRGGFVGLFLVGDSAPNVVEADVRRNGTNILGFRFYVVSLQVSKCGAIRRVEFIHGHEKFTDRQMGNSTCALRHCVMGVRLVRTDSSMRRSRRKQAPFPSVCFERASSCSKCMPDLKVISSA